MRLRVGASTSKGRVRDLNEDAFIAQAAHGLFLVCDGMGGGPAGEVASQMAAATIAKALNEPAQNAAAHRPSRSSYRAETDRLADAVSRSNRVIYEQGRHNPDQRDMGTTVVGAWVRDDTASIAHVGDSRAYLWRDGCLEVLTRDHSLAEALRDEGLSGDAVALGSADEHSLVRVLGGEADVNIDLREVPLLAGDYLLLCSDGLTRMVPERLLADTIARIRDPQGVCDDLVDAANRNGGLDNITVVVVEIGSTWWRRLANGWRRQRTGAHDGEAHATV